MTTSRSTVLVPIYSSLGAIKMSGKEEETRLTGPDTETAIQQGTEEIGASGQPIANESKAVEAVKQVTSMTDDASTTPIVPISTASAESAATAREGGLAPPTDPLPTVGSSSPAPRRPKPPIKGILKPPPPPAKPTLTNRLRDIVTVVGGGAKSLFDPLEPENATAGPSTPQPPSVGGTLNAIGGRLSMGFSRFVSPPVAPPVTPNPNFSSIPPAGSPLPRSVSLPETGGERRAKQPLKRATFLLPSMSITYPITSSGEPWSQKVLEDRKRVSQTK